VASNAAIVADTAAGLAPQVPAERAERGVELLEYHSLRLDVTNLLRDDPLSHLLKDEETLLDDRDRFSVADDLLLLLDDSSLGNLA